MKKYILSEKINFINNLNYNNYEIGDCCMFKIDLKYTKNNKYFNFLNCFKITDSVTGYFNDSDYKFYGEFFCITPVFFIYNEELSIRYNFNNKKFTTLILNNNYEYYIPREILNFLTFKNNIDDVMYLRNYNFFSKTCFNDFFNEFALFCYDIKTYVQKYCIKNHLIKEVGI